MFGRAAVAIDRLQRPQPRPRFDDRGLGRRIEPGELARIGHAPQRAIEHQRRQVRFQDLRRIEARQPCRRRLFPQAIRAPRPLSRRAPCPLRHRRLAGALGDQPRHPRRPIIARPPGQPRIDHHPDAVERQRGFRDRGRQHDLAPPLRIGRDRGALGGRLQAAMQPVQHRATDVAQPLGGPLDLGHAGQEGEDTPRLLAQRLPHRRRHRILDPRFGRAAEMAQRQREAAAFAFHHRRIAHQPGEAAAVERRRHRDQPQVGPQRTLRIERQGKTEIAVEATLMHFVEQHGGDASQLGIGLYAIDEDALGDHRHPRRRRTLAVHPRGIAEGLADAFPRQRRHSLRRRPRREPARRQQQDFAGTPALAEQRRCHGGGLARPRRGDQHRVAPAPQRIEQRRQNSVDRQGGRHSAATIRDKRG
jgi:hypothetical protein